jgi:hypothetical protein
MAIARPMPLSPPVISAAIPASVASTKSTDQPLRKLFNEY